MAPSCANQQRAAQPTKGIASRNFGLAGLTVVKDPGNDDSPADGYVGVEHSLVPHTEVPRVSRRPLHALDLPDPDLCVAINTIAACCYG